MSALPSPLSPTSRSHSSPCPFLFFRLKLPADPSVQVAGNKDPFLVTIILSCCQLLSMCFTMVLVDNWGRRPLTVYGYMITVLAVFSMGAVGTQDVAASDKLGGLLVFFACLATFTTTSSSAIGYAYLSEIPKQDFRAKSAGWGLAIPNFFSIMVSRPDRDSTGGQS